MRLTAKENPETIKRYSHIKPARGRRTETCSATLAGTRRRCTLERGHRGVHVAHGRFRKVVAVWDEGSEAGRGSGRAKRKNRPKGKKLTPRIRQGLQGREPAGIMKALRERALSLVTDVENLIFLVMFLAFLGFAIHWVLLFTGVL